MKKTNVIKNDTKNIFSSFGLSFSNHPSLPTLCDYPRLVQWLLTTTSSRFSSIFQCPYCIINYDLRMIFLTSLSPSSKFHWSQNTKSLNVNLSSAVLPILTYKINLLPSSISSSGLVTIYFYRRPWLLLRKSSPDLSIRASPSMTLTQLLESCLELVFPLLE